MSGWLDLSGSIQYLDRIMIVIVTIWVWSGTAQVSQKVPSRQQAEGFFTKANRFRRNLHTKRSTLPELRSADVALG